MGERWYAQFSPPRPPATAAMPMALELPSRQRVDLGDDARHDAFNATATLVQWLVGRMEANLAWHEFPGGVGHFAPYSTDFELFWRLFRIILVFTRDSAVSPYPKATCKAW